MSLRSPACAALPACAVVAVALFAAACNSPKGGSTSSATSSAAAPVETIKAGYPAPRFPEYLRPPKTVDEMMPQIRRIVRARSGFQGVGLGVMNPGETVGLVVGINADDMTLAALQKGLAERKVKAVILHDYELNGVSREDAQELRRVRTLFTTEQGQLEEASWIETVFNEPDKVKAWLKERRPDLYDKVFPRTRELSPHMAEVREKMRGENTGQHIRMYLEKHPEMRGVFWGKGGSTSLRRDMHPLESRFLGLMMNDNRWDVMGAQGSYPGDIWLLAEQQELEPIPWIDHVRVTDPEGTDIAFDVTPDMADRWARGAYQRGHLYMIPNDATGRFGYSAVDYPAFVGDWIPKEPMAMPTGTIAATKGEGGFFPRWEVHYQDGYIDTVTGGGVVGDLLREFRFNYPHINDLSYPFSSPEHKGYFYLYEIAEGTHPKAFRAADAAVGVGGAERSRDGVFHWGLGITVQHEPGSKTKSQKLLDFTAQYNLPRDHGFHSMTFLTTYQVHLRNTDKTVNLVDKGHMTSLDNPEVRALASRYGDPNELLTEDWIPEFPGINVKGDDQAYAANPFQTIVKVNTAVGAGTYPFFYPPKNTTGAVAHTAQKR